MSLILLLSACASDNVVSNSIIQKRRYTKGYAIWHTNKHKKEKRTSSDVANLKTDEDSTPEEAYTVLNNNDSANKLPGKLSQGLKQYIKLADTLIKTGSHTIMSELPELYQPQDSIEDELIRQEEIQTKKDLNLLGIVLIVASFVLAFSELIFLSPYLFWLGVICLIAAAFIRPSRNQEFQPKKASKILSGCLIVVLAIMILIAILVLLALAAL